MALARMCHIMLVAMVLLFLPSVSRAQADRLATCHRKTLWIVDGGQAFRAGPCSSATWVAMLGLRQAVTYDDSGEKNQRSRAIQSMLQRVSEESFNPVPLISTGLEQVIRRKRTGRGVLISPDPLPPYLRSFFYRAESDPPSTVIVLSWGYRIVDRLADGTFKELGYEEDRRYVQRVAGANPSIGEVLATFKEKLVTTYPEENRRELNLMLPNQKEPLDKAKTLADYNIKNGDILILAAAKSDCRC